MPGLGALYSRVSSYIFGDWNKCGEVMGLAPYGRPDRHASRCIELENGETRACRVDGRVRPAVVAGRRRSDWEKSPSMQHWEDIAWRSRTTPRRCCSTRAIWLRETTGAKNLCIAGGVGLNCVANGRIVREAGFDNVWIQPAAGDDGIAIGCAYYGHLAILKQAALVRDRSTPISASPMRART